MQLDDYPLPAPIRRQALRLLAQIEGADSMIQTVKCGARAEGFVLGVVATQGLELEAVEHLERVFLQVTEAKLVALAG